MKKKKITYGVSGMMEFQAVIKVGRNNMKVLFTDGSMNAMGVNPAKYTTSDYMIQHIIENSPEYKRGLIFRYSVVELDEEVRIERPKPAPKLPDPIPEATPAPAAPADPAPEATSEPAAPAPEAEESDNATPADEDEDTAAPEAEEQDSEPAPAQEHPRVEVEFSVNDDAKDYLEQNYGAVRSKLRTRNDILAFAEAHNVDIKFV